MVRPTGIEPVAYNLGGCDPTILMNPYESRVFSFLSYILSHLQAILATETYGHIRLTSPYLLPKVRGK